MRKILFRGKQINTGEWQYGFYTEKYWVDEKLHSAIHVRKNGYDYAVSSNTVGQYTGLTDKNGNMIFEGDIVKTKFYGKDSGNGQNFVDYDVFKVVFQESSFYIKNSTREFIITAESAKKLKSSATFTTTPN